jgi:hypothetical protein
MTLGSVTVHSLAQLKDLIMSEIGEDLEGYSLLNVAQFERPISELPQEPVLVLRLVPPERLQHDQPEQVAFASRVPTSYKSYCLSRANMYGHKDRALAKLKDSAIVSETLHNLLSVRTPILTHTFMAALQTHMHC